MVRRGAAWWSLGGAACLAMALGTGSCSDGASSGAAGGDDGGTADATSGTCTTDSDCTSLVPPTTPANCATGKCDTIQGTCTFAAKDFDGDGHAAANCKSNNGVPVTAGDDCNDSDPNLYPGHPEPCNPLPDGGAPSEGGAPTGPIVCQEGHISCSPDGTQSSCSGGVVCTNQACVNGACEGVCAPGQTQCSGNGVATCQLDGTWGSPVSCGNLTCANGACGGQCAVGNTQCMGNTLQTCDSTGNWTSTDCTAIGTTCMGVPAACAGSCAPGQTQACGACMGGTATCSGGAYGTCQGAPCTPGTPNSCQTCSSLAPLQSGEDTCTPSCTAGTCYPGTNATWTGTEGDFGHQCGCQESSVAPGNTRWLGYGSGSNCVANGGCAMQYGPYATLSAGHYQVTFEYASACNVNSCGDCTSDGLDVGKVDVTHDYGASEDAWAYLPLTTGCQVSGGITQCQQPPPGVQSVSLTFDVASDCTANYEFRVLGTVPNFSYANTCSLSVISTALTYLGP